MALTIKGKYKLKVKVPISIKSSKSHHIVSSINSFLSKTDHNYEAVLYNFPSKQTQDGVRSSIDIKNKQILLNEAAIVNKVRTDSVVKNIAYERALHNTYIEEVANASSKLKQMIDNNSAFLNLTQTHIADINSKKLIKQYNETVKLDKIEPIHGVPHQSPPAISADIKLKKSYTPIISGVSNTEVKLNSDTLRTTPAWHGQIPWHNPTEVVAELVKLSIVYSLPIIDGLLIQYIRDNKTEFTELSIIEILKTKSIDKKYLQEVNPILKSILG